MIITAVTILAHTEPVLRQIHAGHDTLETFGDARLTDGLILLTLGSSQSAAVFSPSPLLQAQSFRCQMDFRLTAPPGSGEADGIAMVFCPEKKLGVGGYGLGYSGLGGQGDFAVEGISKPYCQLRWTLMRIQSTPIGHKIMRKIRQLHTSRYIARLMLTIDTL